MSHAFRIENERDFVKAVQKIGNEFKRFNDYNSPGPKITKRPEISLPEAEAVLREAILNDTKFHKTYCDVVENAINDCLVLSGYNAHHLALVIIGRLFELE